LSKGKLIVFEGIDGSGKTTQLNLLGEYLKNRGRRVFYTREPGGTKLGESIRDLLLNPEYGRLVPWAEALLYAAARAQLVSEVILPALAAGNLVLCDRYIDSTLAYQGYGRDMEIHLLKQVNEPATMGLIPDLVLLLDFCCETGKDRICRSGRGTDRIEREAREFHLKVRSGYLDIAARDPGRYRVIDANRSIEQVHLDILKAVEGVLECCS